MVMVMMPLIMLLLVRRIVLITLLLILLGRDGFQDVIRPFLGRVLLTVSFHRIHRQTGILYHCVRSLRTETSHRLSDPLLYRVSCKAISLLYPQFFFLLSRAQYDSFGHIAYRVESHEEEEISVDSAIPTIKGTGRRGNNASNNSLARMYVFREDVSP